MGAADEDPNAAVDVEDDESEEEQLTSEWHMWVIGILVVVGIVAIAAPSGILPELLGSLGPLLIALGLIGWVVQWLLSRGS